MEKHTIDSTIEFMYLHTKTMDAQEQVGVRLVELELICDKLNLIIENLSKIREDIQQIDDINQQVDQIGHTLNWCAFLFEDFIYRKYVVRERLWTILGSTLQVSRGKNNGKFVKSIENELNISYPALASAFILLQNEINIDIGVRNVSVHDTIILPIVKRPSITDYVIDDRPIEVQVAAAKQAIIEYTISQEQVIQRFIQLCRNWIDEFKRANL